MSQNPASREIDWDAFSERRDLALEVGDKTFWVSRKALADSSPVFNSMLYGPFQEANQNVVQLPGKEAKEVLEVLRCIFPTNQKTKEVDEENVEILLKFADEYEIEYLTVKCSIFLTKLVKEKCGVDREKEIMKYFLIGIRYKLKKFVRSVLHVFLRCDMAKVLEYGCELPVEVRFAILLPLSRQKFEHIFQPCCAVFDACPRPFYICKFCFTRDVDDDREDCNVGHCGTCSEGFGKTGIFCECIDPMAIAELEKVGL